MKVYLKSIGDLRDYFGRAPQEIEVPEDATFRLLLTVIDERWGSSLPPYLWDAQKRNFKGAVYFVLDKRVVQDLDTPLHDGQEVILMKALSGG